MNSFGRIFRVHIFGESHGESVGFTIDGCPAGLPLTVMILLQILKEEKVVQKVPLHAKKMIFQFLKAVFLIIKQQVHLLPFSLKIIIPAVQIMQKQRAVPRPGHADFVA